MKGNDTMKTGKKLICMILMLALLSSVSCIAFAQDAPLLTEDDEERAVEEKITALLDCLELLRQKAEISEKCEAARRAALALMDLPEYEESASYCCEADCCCKKNSVTTHTRQGTDENSDKYLEQLASCQMCKGKGLCPYCFGTGQDLGSEPKEEYCPHCYGTGLCPNCHGKGLI